VLESQYSWPLLFSTGQTFARSDENYGAWREPRDAIGNAPDQVAIQTGQAARREND